jgi:TetR/AcrR family transcriptional repressor of nem operon
LSTTDTRETIMSISRAMVQARGYNALSFRDIAKEVGVKSASIHYHFPTKGDLGAALARRYTEDGGAYLEMLLEEPGDLATRMRKYTDIFRSALVNDNRMCLCGIMAAEYVDLPVEVRTEVEGFTAANVAWLVKLLTLHGPAAEPEAIRGRALAIFAAMEGAQLVARGRSDVAVFDDVMAAYRASGLLP